MTQQTINEFIREAYQTACEKGFHDEEHSDEHYLMLIITELSEAVEAHRKGRWADWKGFEKEGETKEAFERYIKDTVEDELADACIRIFDLAGLANAKLIVNKINDGFDKDLDFPVKVFWAIQQSYADVTWYDLLEQPLSYLLYNIICMAKDYKIDLERHIREKMRYNKTRGKMHGKKY